MHAYCSLHVVLDMGLSRTLTFTLDVQPLNSVIQSHYLGHRLYADNIHRSTLFTTPTTSRSLN